MNATSILEIVGQVAGIGGLALGVLLLLFREVIRKNIFPNLAQVQAYRIIQLVVVLTFLIAAGGLAAWVYVQPPGTGTGKTAFYQSAPRLIAPDGEAKLDVFPREISYVWHPVPGATRYELEVQYFDGSTNLWNPLPAGTGSVVTPTPSATTGFVGAQPGRWRVTPINAANEKGQGSEWRTFSYMK